MKIVVLERAIVGMDIDTTPFSEFGEVTEYDNTSYEQIGERIRDAEIVIMNKSRLDASVLGRASKLRMICEFATGYDNIDIAYCRAHGIAVANVSGYSTKSVAQHTLALYFYLAEHLRHYDDYVKKGAYSAQPYFACFDEVFHEATALTWGIVGLGNIGRSVAQAVSALGFKVVYYSTTGKHADETYEQVDFERLLSDSDVISIHCPLNERTNHLFDETALRRMKKSAILINVARGGVVDNAALASALMHDEIAAAGLDVVEGEPIALTNPLMQVQDSNKLLITPHMAWGSVEARTRLVSETCLNIKAFINGDSRNRVDLIHS